MTPAARRMTYAEAQLVKEKNGRFCAGCRTVFTPDQVATSFAADERTRDGLSKLCIKCIEHRDEASQTRLRSTRSDAQAAYRDLMRDVRIASAMAALEALLPEHGIPLCALPDYPPGTTTSTLRPQDVALYARLYGRLRDAGVTTWEQLAGKSRTLIAGNIPSVGPRALALIDEHLRAFDLDPLTP